MLILILIVFFVFFLNLLMFLSNKFLLDKEKLFSFECGFNSFESYRNSFSIQFFKILLIFLLFDMEIIIILPFPLGYNLSKMMWSIFLGLMFFLVLGLYFEWKEGSLEWLN